MKLYAVRDWDSIYENNRTRELKNLAWVPIPNNHDGYGYSAIMSLQDGPAIYGAWIACVQVASRCDPRGTLLRGTKTPHTPRSLALQTRLPEELVSRMLDVLSSEDIQWLTITESSGTNHTAPKCDNLAHKCDNIAERCLEQNRTEQNSTYTHSPSNSVGLKVNHPTLTDVIEFGKMRGVSEEVSTNFYNHYDSQNWISDAHIQITNWQSRLMKWNGEEKNRIAPRANSAPANGKPKSVFELKTVMEAKIALASELKNKHCAEHGLGDTWSDQTKRAEYRKLKTEIRDLQKQIGAAA